MTMNAPLGIARCLFQYLEETGVRHCQWKSNQHLAEALSGLTDIDLLVDKAQATQCERILNGLSFKRFQSQPWGSYPGIEHWLGLDEGTGKLVQVHLYYQLLSGAKLVKEQHLPWEKLILDTAIKDPRYDIRITDPNIEMLLLIVRIGLKTSLPRIARGMLGQDILSKDLLAEFDYLLEQTDPAILQRYAAELLSPECAAEIGEIIRRGSPADPATVWRIKSAVSRAIQEHRRYAEAAGLVFAAQRRLYSLGARALRKLDIASQAGKRLHSGGALIAVVGCDGSGKSTVSKELQEWLSWKIDSHEVYFGTGDGLVSAPVKFAKNLAGMQVPGKARPAASVQERPEGKRQKSSVREMGSRVLGFMIAVERRKKVLKANRLRLNGGIIVADRYPQNQFVGINDGPRTRETGERSSRIGRFLARRELDIYDEIGEFAPDIVVKLHVPVEVARTRKPDHSVEEIRRKAEITDNLQFPYSQVIDIDASKSLDCVLLTVKKRVWNSL
jgi:hypothetical protein